MSENTWNASRKRRSSSIFKDVPGFSHRSIVRTVVLNLLTGPDHDQLLSALRPPWQHSLQRERWCSRRAALSNQLLRAISLHEGDVEAALSALFTWTSEFSASGLTEYADEMQRLVHATSEPGGFGRLLQAQVEWRETAAAYAAGLRPLAPFDLPTEPTKVERP